MKGFWLVFATVVVTYSITGVNPEPYSLAGAVIRWLDAQSACIMAELPPIEP